ncbi:MAG TPA: glycosyltransferase [Mycobacteriales bacterium]|nr:glycosyltransferase [Mycobacteriales bacterium]
MSFSAARPRAHGSVVTAVLVCRDGAAWLPAVLSAVAAQTRAVERFVAVDTGSRDESVQLVSEICGESAVLVAADAGFADAVQRGLAGFDPVAQTEWVWLLHDDSAPDPTALEELLARVEHAPSIWMVGPKVLDWDGQRLVQAGLTIDGGGHIDTGLDGREVDQGQRDDVDEVLAVGSAGALIRRDVWDRLGGLPPQWPTEAGDVDLGWRVNAADGRVVVASRAIVRHAAAHDGDRHHGGGDGDLATRRLHGMQVVLANARRWTVPLLLLRLVAAALSRAVGQHLFARRFQAARAELSAAARLVTHYNVVSAARRQRDQQRTVSHGELRHLRPPPGSRWRQVSVSFGGFGRDHEATRSTAAVESGPVSEDVESLATDIGAVARFFRRPGTLLFLGMTLIALVAERGVLSTTLHGGQLLPVPGGASDLWSIYLSAFHPVSVGSANPAPTSVAVLALLSTLSFGKVWFAIDVILLGAVPLAAMTAYWSLRAVTPNVLVRLWVAVGYALLPAVTGAVAAGHVDVALIAILLPLLLRAAAAALRTDPVRGDWHRSVGTGLLLAVVTAFVPALWLTAAVVLLVGALSFPVVGDEIGRRMRAVAVILAAAALALVPWSGQVLAHPSWLLGAVPATYGGHDAPVGLSLVLLRAGGAAQPPVWIGIPLVAAAIVGLRRRRSAPIARIGGVLLVLGVVAGVVVTRSVGVVTGVPDSRHWPGVWMVVAGAGVLLAAAVALTGGRQALRSYAFGWRQPTAIALAGFALVATVTVAVGWLVRGAGGPLTGANPALLPAFAQAEVAQPASPRVLVLNATGPTITYALVRRPTGPTLGDRAVAPHPRGAVAQRLAGVVRDLVAGRPGAAAALPQFGIQYVAAAAPSASVVSPALGKATTLTVEPAPGVTVWKSSLPAGELALLDPADAARARAGQLTTGALHVVPASGASADTQIGGGSPGRMVVLAEPADHRWHAELNGESLPRVTAYGWAQGFLLPTSGGRLTVGFSGGSRPWWLAVELIVIAALLVLALPAWRREESE